MKLREIAHSRTGDKGNTSNISVIGYDPAKYPLLEKQGGLVVEMAKTLQIGVETRSVDVLHKITEQDDLVDEVFLEVKEKIVTDIQEKTINASVAVDLLLMGKYFEKMGDHLSSIARHQLRLIERKW